MTSCSPELRAIKTAIINEHEGYHFYQMAAEKASSQEVKDVFLYLAEEEKSHEDYLKKVFDAVKNNTVDTFGEACGRIDSPRVFTPDIIKNEDASLIVSALSMGVRMEKESIDFYREAAKNASFESVKKIYLNLAEWEAEHIDTLHNAYDLAREEWWDRQGFSPA